MKRRQDGETVEVDEWSETVRDTIGTVGRLRNSRSTLLAVRSLVAN